MRLISQALGRTITAVALSALLAAACAAWAGEAIEVDSPPPDDTSNQVLELPQHCEDADMAAACDQANADPDADTPDAQASADNNGQAAANPAAAGGDYADQAANQDWGTLQQYRDQGTESALASSVVQFGSGAMVSEVYVARPILVPAPRPFMPYVPATGPFVARVMPAPGPIIGVNPAWTMPAGPIAPIIPLTTVHPMMPAGMARGFRLR